MCHLLYAATVAIVLPAAETFNYSGVCFFNARLSKCLRSHKCENWFAIGSDFAQTDFAPFK